MEISEREYAEIENDLIRLCNTVAIPRFIKALRNAVELDLPLSPNGVTPDFRQQFVDWISYGNLTTNFEPKPTSRSIIRDEDIPF